MENKNRELYEKLVRENFRTDKNGRRDLYSIYRNRELLDQLISGMAETFDGKADFVVSPASNGFILGSLLAEKLGIGFIPFKNGGMEYLDDEDYYIASYIDHADKPRTLQIRKENLPEGSKVILVDDWIETAATSQACMTILEEAKGSVLGIFSLGAEYSKLNCRQIETGFLHCLWCRKQS